MRMREILFRGKRENNGEWVEGNLFIPDREDTPTQICIGTNVIRITYDVIPETVGQYTGLTDKNGRKIFEGDIVKYKNNSPCKIEYIDCQFVMMWKNLYRDFENVYDHDIRVIGNIHDNPELLKVGTEE